MTDTARNSSDNAEHLLGLDQHSASRKYLILWASLFFVLLFLFFSYKYFALNPNQAVQYKTANVQWGNIVITVTATGKPRC